jgi:hypothetical protein
MGDKTLTLTTRSEHASNKWPSSIGDWVAPVLVWVVCIGMLLAILSVLLGRAE